MSMADDERAKILVVEDEEAIGQGLCDVLAFRGHAVEWAKDGAIALTMGQSSEPDLILLDVMLPSLDGYSVAQKLRAAGVACGIIMLTAKGSEADILKGFEAGADDYVTKPFD
ncbi:MAG: response regulator transcription factor, partial [Deltaproteobacteria bacterium]|nr:response regulator transcription factor [Deltaproteobacteria bacterium]